MKNSKMFSMLSLIAMILGFFFIASAEPEPCTISQQCTADAELSCTSYGGDCEKKDCDELRCGTVTIPTDTCPLCDVIPD